MSTKWDPKDVQPGDNLIATDAGGVEHEVRAITGLWFAEYPDLSTGRLRWVPGPAITVGFTTKDREGRVWPVSALRPAGDV